MRCWIISVLAILVLIIGCSSQSDEPLTPEGYKTWASTVDQPLEYEIPGHTQAVRLIYINDVGTTVKAHEESGRVTYDYPEGTVLLKENYPQADDKTPSNLTVMIKAPDDPRARGGWIWLNKDLASGKERVFTDEFCFDCHQNANERHPYGDGNQNREFRDYVYYPWSPPG